MIHLYLGDGKGKTTAAIGLAIRMLGWNKRVLVAQFLKHMETGENNFFSDVEDITFIRPLMRNKGFIWNMDQNAVQETKEDMEKGFKDICGLLVDNNFSLIILDEILDTIDCGLLKEAPVINLIQSSSAEFVLTGRKASLRLKKIADYITVMVKEKHPFEKGITSRRGIEY